MTVQTPDNVVTAEVIESIAQEVWGSFVDAGLESGPGGANVPDEQRITGIVQVSGEWRGALLIEGSDALARRAAAAMFDADPGSLADEEVFDALGELTNMIGGNVKCLLPSPSYLSTPAVAQGPAYVLHIPGASLVSSVPMHWGDEPLTVTLWKS